MRLAFVTNFCPHYRVTTFEKLSRQGDFDFYFFSEGKEWYWEQKQGVWSGGFRYVYLPGFRVGGTRVTPTLLWLLFFLHYDVYIKCINGRFALPITYLVARLRNRPFILWTGVWAQLQTKFHRAIFPITRFIYRHADAIVVYGVHVKRFLIDQGVESERIFIAPHAIDNQSFYRPIDAQTKAELRRELSIREHKKVVLFVGRLEVSKGVRYLLEGFAHAKLADTILLIAGTGSERKKLERKAQELGITERVRFAGHVPMQRVNGLYAIATMLVLPSVTTPSGKEPWGLVVNEAFCYGIPVIATEAVGAAAGELVQNNVNGLVIPERDTGSIALAIRSLATDRVLRERLGDGARETINSWGEEKMVDGFVEAIDYVIEGKLS